MPSSSDNCNRWESSDPPIIGVIEIAKKVEVNGSSHGNLMGYWLGFITCSNQQYIYIHVYIYISVYINIYIHGICIFFGGKETTSHQRCHYWGSQPMVHHCPWHEGPGLSKDEKSYAPVGDFVSLLTHPYVLHIGSIPSGKPTKSYWKWP